MKSTSKLEHITYQTQFSFMPDVSIQCYNRLQILRMKEYYKRVNEIPDHKDVKVPGIWAESYFKSEYAIRIAEELQEKMFLNTDYSR